jgi:hypothetical protein
MSEYERIDLDDPRCVELWCAALLVDQDQLFAAVRRVGQSGDLVAEVIWSERRLVQHMRQCALPA